MEININNETTYTIDVGYKNTIESLSLDIKNQSYFLCIDSRVFLFFEEYLKPLINDAQDIIIIEADETNKSMDTVDEIHEMLFKNEATRSSYVIAIGGGIIGDVVGLAASLYMRGLKLIQVPTTLLSQVDSSIGNKVAVNSRETKNSIGTFYAPTKVIIDLFFLEKLTTRIFVEGLVELIKHGLIQDTTIIKDLEKYNNIDELRNDSTWLKTLIEKSLTVKKDIVQQDPLDTHLRHVLNLGHTFAHALELSDNNHFYHGEAVAIGILVMANLNEDRSIFDKVFDIFNRFDCIRELSDVDLNKVLLDKKRNNKIIKEIYLTDIGVCEIKEVEIPTLVNDFKESYENLQDNIVGRKTLYKFSPVNLKGSVDIPPSKSQLHRYLIAAALSKETTILNGVSCVYDDVIVTMKALEAFNMDATYEQEQQRIIVQPSIATGSNNLHVHMKESGTSLRLLMPLLLDENNEVLITGENKLPTRPLDIYLNIFKQNNVKYEMLEDTNLPIKLKGSLKPGVFELAGDISSQFISGLLFSLPLLEGNSKIVLTSKLESLPYVQMSLETLEDFNITIKHNDDYSEFYIDGNQSYTSKKYYIIEQDYSSRCFFEVAKSFKQHDININNLITPTKQGDSKVIEIIENKASELDLTDIPDVAPIMAIYYAMNGGTMTNTQRLAFKESDRLQAICEFLDVMKISYTLKDNSIIINKGTIHGGVMNTHEDHRITMSIIIASTIALSSVYVSEIKSINKSFSTFINTYEKLGGFIDEK